MRGLGPYIDDNANDITKFKLFHCEKNSIRQKKKDEDNWKDIQYNDQRKRYKKIKRSTNPYTKKT